MTNELKQNHGSVMDQIPRPQSLDTMLNGMGYGDTFLITLTPSGDGPGGPGTDSKVDAGSDSDVDVDGGVGEPPQAFNVVVGAGFGRRRRDHQSTTVVPRITDPITDTWPLPAGTNAYRWPIATSPSSPSCPRFESASIARSGSNFYAGTSRTLGARRGAKVRTCSPTHIHILAPKQVKMAHISSTNHSMHVCECAACARGRVFVSFVRKF